MLKESVDMSGVNKVILLGNLGADPEVRHLENGAVVARLRLATSESYKNKNGERVETTEWHDVEMWEGLAKVAEQYLKKGATIYVEGKIKSESWQDDQGNNRKRVKVRAMSMTMVGKGNNESSAPSSDSSNVSGTVGDDNLPF